MMTVQTDYSALRRLTELAERPRDLAGMLLHGGIHPYRLTSKPVVGEILDRFTDPEIGLQFALYRDELECYSWRILLPEAPILLKSIAVRRLEGHVDECSIWHEYDRAYADSSVPMFHDAQMRFYKWRGTVRKGSIDKCDFRITWQNGQSYEGRYDLGSDGTDYGKDLHESFRYRVFFYSGLLDTPHNFMYDSRGNSRGTPERCRAEYMQCTDTTRKMAQTLLAKHQF